FQSHVNVTTREDYSNVKPSNEARPLDNLPEQVITPSGDPFGIEDLILKTSKIHKKDAPMTGNSEPEFPPGFTLVNSNHKVNETVPAQVIHDHSSVQRSKEASNNVVDDDITDFELNNKSYCGSNLDHTDSMAHCSKPVNGFSILERLGGKEKKQWVKKLCHSNQAYMADIISRWHGEVVAMGDFNEVRYASERHGSTFYASNAAEFNMFIVNSHLNEIPLGGYSFTWSDKYVNKMKDDFTYVIEDSWNDDEIIAPNPMILLKNKLKSLKQRLKTWSSEKKCIKDHDRKRLQDSLIAIDLRLDQDVSLPDDLLNHANIVRDLHGINKKDLVDLAQKAKVKWAIEGDENTKFFHSIVNKKRRHLVIKGILIDGEWIDNPTRVKLEFYNHFARFSSPNWTRVPFDDQFPSRLNIDHSCDLERDVTIEEIKKAVWDCGSDKSSGPEGFTFEFFNKYWSMVGNDVGNAVKEFFSSSTFPNGCNPSFIALIPKVLYAKRLNDFRPSSLVGCQYKIISKILANRLSLVIDDIISQEQSAFVKGRQIMDGPIILNEAIAWYKSKKEQSLLFKVDFQKAFDSVRWDHLGDILVNGSPTDEFTFHRGLRQGDPLSPFLFILVMESLHVSFLRLIDRGMFTPISVGNDNLVPISHLFYADDAISIFGVGVRSSDVHSMAVRYGCLASTLPFTYLGVKVGANMKRVNSWGEVVKKVTSKLSTCKVKTLSVRGRLTLIKSVLGAILTYYMSLFKAPEGVLKHLERIRNSFFLGADLDKHKITWVSWRKVMAQKQHGCNTSKMGHNRI
ncbi:RNA-directed DNA polymerase, eukaryota, partial [Tanacetum coccineum]